MATQRLTSFARRCAGAVWLFATLCLPAAVAAAADNTPQDLEAWSDWVLDDVKDYGCPILHNANSRRCAWPSRLELDLNGQGGAFTQVWSVDRETVITLPGRREQWPLNVTIDGKAATVVSRAGLPAIRLAKGHYRISGSFDWKRLPESLAVSAESGLVTLRLAGEAVTQPDIRNGQLWLSADKEQTQKPRRTDIKVFRKITDEVPLQVETRIEIEISGDQREISLLGALPAGFEPVRVNSRLPARLGDDGALTLKARPGRWVVNVGSRLNSEILALKLAGFPAPWPTSELWVFEPRPHLRLLKVESPASIDASQSALPERWKKLPAYRMQAGENMLFEQIRRGDPEPEPDQLSLERELWLDFDGGGYSVSDRISGTLSRSSRIDASGQLLLGQVTLDGKPQLITRAGDGASGIELRQGHIELAADSRIEDPLHQLSASGWRHDFNRVSTRINIPPGYRVLAITGADRSPATWLSDWTLLDFFIVLIATIALSNIHGKGWGAVGLIGFIVLWHEPGAPSYIWLNLIATLAVMRALKNTRVFAFARNYLMLSALALVLIALPFMVQHVRDGIYPQLEYTWQSMGEQTVRQQRAERSRAPLPASKSESLALMDLYDGGISSIASQADKRKQQETDKLDDLLQDPNARLQTGPGLPEWTWRSYQVHWNGPVQKDQTLSIYLIGPPLLMLLNFFRVFIVLLLGWKLISGPVTELLTRIKQPASTAKSTALSTGLLLLMVGGAVSMPGDALAAYPPPDLLQELKQRLLKPAECLPQCAEIEAMAIRLDPDKAEFSLTAHAEEDLALPLPVPLNDWTPSSVIIDGKAAPALFRDRNQTLWLYLDKGVHEIGVEGRIAHLRSLRLDFPLRPQKIDVSLQGWTIDGADSLSQSVRSMTFTREQGEQQQAVFDTRSDIPLFAQVSRHIRMGLDWQVVTRVRLESGTALPALLHIPLLTGEAVVSDGIEVENGQVLVSLSESNRSLSWLSSLKQTDSLELSAPKSQPWAETWRLEVTPIWHVQTSGIPVIYHQQSGGRWNPEWRPWPGEQVALTITRPPGVAGQTKTIDHSLLTITPGKRATATELKFTLRSSQGQQHTITLPQHAELESVSIGNTAVPVRQAGRSVTLPVSPGSQDFTIKWKQANGIDWLFSTPDIDLGMASVNARIVLKSGYDRWILLAGGIQQGPAVLFWGVLIVIVLIAIGLGRIKGTPLKTHSWILLGIGLSTVTPFIALLIAVWIFALYARGRVSKPKDTNLFNAMQVGLVILTFVAVAALFGAVSNGLLGNPEMQIAGNGSTHWQLNWFQDRLDSATPQAWVISVPVLAYRFLMLAWSMWMAFALINWLKWGWGCFSRGQLWIAMPKRVKRVNRKPEPPKSTASPENE